MTQSFSIIYAGYKSLKKKKKKKKKKLHVENKSAPFNRQSRHQFIYVDAWLLQLHQLMALASIMS